MPLNVSEYLRGKGKVRRDAEREMIGLDLVNGKNAEDGGLGLADGGFNLELFQPKEKSWVKRKEEILLEVKRRILLKVCQNKNCLIVIQLGFWWWWKWEEERRLKELTAINSGRGWRSFNEEQKKKWIKWNKELNWIAETLIEWLSVNSYRWLYVVDRKIKEFFNNNSFSLNDELNRNNKDCVGLVLMYWEGKLTWFEKEKTRLGKDYYWNNHERINGKK